MEQMDSFGLIDILFWPFRIVIEAVLLAMLWLADVFLAVG